MRTSYLATPSPMPSGTIQTAASAVAPAAARAPARHHLGRVTAPSLTSVYTTARAMP
jgi:hypothetical protein